MHHPHTKFFFNFLILFAVSCFLLLTACDSDDDDGPVLTSITIESSNGNKLDLNATTQLTAKGLDQFNNPIVITDPLVWSASNDHVTVDQNGHVVAQSIGTSVITVSTGTIDATLQITIWDSSAPRTEIYVSDAGNFDNPPWQILKFDENGDNPEIFISQNLAWPQDIIFLENEGVVLISNLNSGNIARHNINTGNFMNNFATGIGGPTRMKIGPDNLLYVLQWTGNGLVLRYELDGSFVDQFTNLGVNQSIGLDWDIDGNLYVSSFGDATVRKFDPTGNDLGLFINSGLQGPTNIWFDPDGNLLVNDWSGGAVRQYASNGTLIGDLITGLSQPEGIDFFSSDTLLIGNGGTGAVKRYLSNGNYIDDFIPASSGGLLTPNAVVIRKVNQ